MCSPRNESCDVCDVGHKNGIHFARDLGERFEVDRAWDRGPTTEDQLRPMFHRKLAHLVHVNTAVLAADSVPHGTEPLTGDRHVPTMGEVSPHGQGHPNYCVAGLEE